jgi:O-antigen/teichoic acid export membrane protein
MKRKAIITAASPVVLLLLPCLIFFPVVFGGRTLVPADILFRFEPFLSAAPSLGVDYPQNHLLGDLLLENYAWKSLLVRALRSGELPLWDPYLFAGHPFLANGQHSAIYPLSILFYILPLWQAYGVFIALQLGLAGVSAYVFGRTLGIGRFGSLISGITFQFSGFMLVSVVHPMIIAGASWLPLILASIEMAVTRRALVRGQPTTLPWVLLGALCVGVQMLAGHAENTYFVFLVTLAYSMWRVFGQGRRDAIGDGAASALALLRTIASIVLMLVLGMALGSVQFIPLIEVVSSSFRGGEAAASLQQVLQWAYPWRRLITFAVPNFFGNPSHHRYVDVFSWRWVQAPRSADGQYVYWGVKNFVEGGAYLGLLPLAFAALAILLTVRVGRGHPDDRGTLGWFFKNPYVPFFALLAVFSLGCVFGTPIYALVYSLPLLKQSHSPFRWVFPLTLCVAVLAGFGASQMQVDRALFFSQAEDVTRKRKRSRRVLSLLLLGAEPSVPTVFGAAAFWGGIVTVGGLALTRILFGRFEGLIQYAYTSLAKASDAFPDHRAFYSYEILWVGLFGLLLITVGLVLRLAYSGRVARRAPAWELLVAGVLVVDFVAFGGGFNPTQDPALLEHVPPSVDFLANDRTVWRYATFTPPGTTKTFNANVGMLYGLQSVSGYDSLFTRAFADYMRLIEDQDELQYNRIASLREWSSLDSPLLDLLNVKYVITEVEIPNPKYTLAYEDQAVRIYENLAALPRAYSLPVSATLMTDDFGEQVQSSDPRSYVIIDASEDALAVDPPRPAEPVAQAVRWYGLNEVEVEVRVDRESWVVLADAFFPGWKAFISPSMQGQGDEVQTDLFRVNGVFRGVRVQPGNWIIRYKYSPDSVKVGGFVSFLAGMVILFLAGMYLWRYFYREEDNLSTVRRVAKNSVAPIVINLFNRSIEMAFAALAARILGPAGNGRYATAVNIYLWFDTLANFGLDMYVMREVARDRSNAWRTLVNTSALRVMLFLAVIPALAGLLAGRQRLGEPLASETVLAVALLYVGLLPGSLANGLAALFRGFEKHEYPAAIQTVTTVVRVTLGVLALAMQFGLIGLAGVSIITNLATLGILAALAWRLILPGLGRAWPIMVSWSLQRVMLSGSWPLMASLLLQSLFTGLNLVLLQQLQGDTVVGWYDAARKWLDAVNIVPSFFTYAVFPVMTRQAVEDRSALERSYRLSVKLLLVSALPVAMFTTLFATLLVGTLSGAEFLPDGAIVLQILIWSVLFGWINSLTNYVLIALDRQRYVLLASSARVAFTVMANVAFVGRFSYVGSAWIIIGGEFLLLALFYLELRRHLGAFAWRDSLGRPLAAGLAMGLALWAVAPYGRIAALGASLIAYVFGLFAFRAVSPEDVEALVPILPRSLRAVLRGRNRRAQA